ncbi:MAG: hypothetical protein ABIY71_04200, partial [Flavobacteriales bacterium]
MDNSTNPFSPNTPLTREVLERYASGQLSPAERHAVELHLENDPLLQDAVEGLMMHGAVEAFATMHGPKTSGPGNGTYLAVGAALVIGGIGLWVALSDTATFSPQKDPEAFVNIHAPTAIPAAVESTLLVVYAEIEALPDRPEVFVESGQAPDRFQETDAAPQPVERPVVERMAGTPVKLDRATDIPTPAVKHAPKASRRLLYLHGLKVVHPDEMARDRNALLRSPGVAANLEPKRRDSIPSGPSALPYLSLLDDALGAFTRGEERTA